MIAKSMIAASLLVTSIMALASEESVMTCQMNIMTIDKGDMRGEPRAAGEVILTSGNDQFYAVVGERIMKSPLMVERNGRMAAYHSGAVYLMKNSTFSILFDDFGYVFDECVKVT